MAETVQQLLEKMGYYSEYHFKQEGAKRLEPCPVGKTGFITAQSGFISKPVTIGSTWCTMYCENCISSGNGWIKCKKISN